MPPSRVRLILVSCLIAAFGACSPVPVATPTASLSGSISPASLGPGATGPPSAGPPSVAQRPGPVVSALLSLRLPVATSRAVAFVDGQVLVLAGGLTDKGTTAAILTIDLGAGRETVVSRLPSPVHDAATALVGSVPTIFGGGNLAPETVVQQVSLAVATSIGQLPMPRADLGAVTVSGDTFVIGGGTPSRLDREILVTADGMHYRGVGVLRFGVRYAAIASTDASILVVGGTDGSHDLAVIQSINPITGVVRVIGQLPHGLSHAAAFVVGGRVLVAGGRFEGRAQDAIWEIDPATGGATLVGHLPIAISDVAPVVLDGVAYLLGGETTRFEASIIEVRVG